MILSIEFTAEHIHIVEEDVNAKSITVKRFIEIPMPDGSYLNGVIVNTAAVAAAIQVAVKEHRIHTKKSIVTVSGVDILRKEFQVPSGNNKHTRGMVENELNKAGMLRSDYLFDYIIKKNIQKDQAKSETMQNVDVYLMPRALVNNYLTTLRRAGLTPYRIETVSNSMERLAFLLKVADGDDMSILCCAERDQIGLLFTGAGTKMIYRSTQIKAEDTIEENAFIVSAVQSLNREVDPIAIALEEIVENISKLVQFHSQTGKKNKVGQILMYGDLSRDSQFLSRIENATGITTIKCDFPDHVTFAGPGDLTCLNAIGASAGGLYEVAEEKDIDFFPLMKEKKAEKTTKKDLIPLAAGMGLILILSGIYALQSSSNMTVEASVQMSQDFINDPENQKLYQKAKALQDYTISLAEYNETCNQYIDVIKNTRRLESNDFNELDAKKPEDVTIKSYGYSNGEITISCDTTNQDGASAFAKILSDSGLYTDVKYTGFSSGSSEDGSANYTFQLVCTLWAQSGGVSE
ncbi:PilN domain-containing protein [Robinsoniella peoriensis]|uniref:PilN domain-containing protein n=1 Tax=Robinsoniella peoriensis TaxID=180332 RepID=UPI00366A58AC